MLQHSHHHCSLTGQRALLQGRERQREGLLGLWGGTAEKDRVQSEGQTIQPQRSHPNRKRLSARQAGLETDQRVSGDQDIRDPPGLVLAASVTGMLCLQKTKIPNGFNTLGGEKHLSLHCGARPPTWALSTDACV